MRCLYLAQLTQTIQNGKDIGSILLISASRLVYQLVKATIDFLSIITILTDANHSFNANDIASARIELNHRTFRKGFIALDGVGLKNNKAHTYKITFFGETIDLKNKLKETKYSVSRCGTYDHTYNVNNVKLDEIRYRVVQ